jgi:hypothetical protein
MPIYKLTYTVTMPGSTGKPEKFRTKITAANAAEAKVKLHRIVQEKVMTTFDSCEEDKPDLPEAIKDLFEAADIMARSERLRAKYGLAPDKK